LSKLVAQSFLQDNRALIKPTDGENLNNRLNIIGFGGPFSGNAIGPP
jgi:hypothetical protein